MLIVDNDPKVIKDASDMLAIASKKLHEISHIYYASERDEMRAHRLYSEAMANIEAAIARIKE